ncbi:MAG: Entericidin EcnA/B family protein [Planctomycetes bacterium]|nr:Entericidin EcnA/B family protein [Planctomycetota bacterium]
MAKKILLVIVLFALLLWFVGCSTIKGLGQDIQTIGEAGEKVIE